MAVLHCATKDACEPTPRCTVPQPWDSSHLWCHAFELSAVPSIAFALCIKVRGCASAGLASCRGSDAAAASAEPQHRARDGYCVTVTSQGCFQVPFRAFRLRLSEGAVLDTHCCRLAVVP